MKISKKNLFIFTAMFTLMACGHPKSKLAASPQDAVTTAPPETNKSPLGKVKIAIQAEADAYRLRYNLHDVFMKATDNHGNNYENLYGTRNFRVVLHGVYYRGGANNVYNRDGVRDNSNPLPANGLDNLCKEDFSTAIYFYPTNYSSAPKVLNCRSRTDMNNTMNYNQTSILSLGNYDQFLGLIYSRIKGQLKGPIYGHCWNGWHASGLAAAVTLKQFCGYSDDQAVAYWIKNTDGASNFPEVIRKVRDFKASSQFAISAAEAQAICP
jgi:hypothetical protein